MEQLISSRVKDIQMSGIRKFFNLVTDIPNVISLTIGQPDFSTPNHIKDVAKLAIDENFTTYTHNGGYLALREAATNYVHTKYNLSYHPETEVIVTVGASQAIDITFRTILEMGDEVILPAPIYPGYEPIIHLCGAKAVYLDTRDTNFKVTAYHLEQLITEKTKCIVLPYPSNPTGVSLHENELIEIAHVLKGKPIFVLADEIYSELTYEKQHVSIASYLREQTIVVNGLSKSHSMTGWRIGFVFAPEFIMKHMIKVHQYNVTCASSISQKAAYAALTEGINDAIPMRMEYFQRRNYVFERLTKMGLETVMPDGAFYFFVKIPEENIHSLDYCLKLVNEAKVAVVPGSSFSSYGEGYFRLSYAYSMKILEEGLNRIENFLSK